MATMKHDESVIVPEAALLHQVIYSRRLYDGSCSCIFCDLLSDYLYSSRRCGIFSQAHFENQDFAPQSIASNRSQAVVGRSS